MCLCTSYATYLFHVFVKRAKCIPNKVWKGKCSGHVLFMPAQGPFLLLENDCGTTLTTAYSLGETVNLVRLLPLPDKGMATRHRLGQSIRSLLLSPLFKTSPPPPSPSPSPQAFSFPSYSQVDINQPLGFKYHLYEFKIFNFKYHSPAQTSPMNPRWPSRMSNCLLLILPPSLNTPTPSFQPQQTCFFLYYFPSLKFLIVKHLGVTSDSSLSFTPYILAAIKFWQLFLQNKSRTLSLLIITSWDHSGPSPTHLPPALLHMLSHWWPWLSFWPLSLYSQQSNQRDPFKV